MSTTRQVPTDYDIAKRSVAHRANQDQPCVVRSDELLKGRRELWIEHGDDMYRLRLTSSGKLYLTK